MSDVRKDAELERRRLDAYLHIDCLRNVSMEFIPRYSENLSDAMNLAETIRLQTGGHFSLLAFTTHWKAGFSTPDLRGGKGAEDIASWPPAETPALAIALAASSYFDKIGAVPFAIVRAAAEASNV